MGWVRFILALGVLLSHSPHQLLPMITGRFSVVIFFMISGFYMRMVWEEKYSKLPARRRLWSFYRARLLRLMPLYWLSVLCIGLIGIYYPLAYFKVFPTAALSTQVISVVSNLALVGQDLFWFLNFDGAYLGLPTWAQLQSNDFATAHVLAMNVPAFSIAVELYFYLLVPFLMGFARSKIFWGVAAATWILYGLAREFMSFRLYYHLAPMNACFFLTGILAYSADPLRYLKRWPADKVRIGLLVLNTVVVLGAWKWIGVYGTFLFFALSVPVTFELTRHSKLDRFIGDLSYALFLFHFPIIRLLEHTVQWEPIPQTLLNVGVSLAACLFIQRFIEVPIKRITTT